MEKKIEISILCQLYGNLLTEKQMQYIDDYCNNDLSLTEIAENNGVTRQAVKDILTKSEKKLYDYEEKLHFKKIILDQEEKMHEIVSLLEQANKVNKDEEISKILKKAKREIKYLVLD